MLSHPCGRERPILWPMSRDYWSWLTWPRHSDPFRYHLWGRLSNKLKAIGATTWSPICGEVRHQDRSATPIAFQMTFPVPKKHWKESKIYSYSAFKFKFHLMISGDVSLLFLTSLLIIQNIRSRVFPSRLILKVRKHLKKKAYKNSIRRGFFRIWIK